MTTAEITLNKTNQSIKWLSGLKINKFTSECIEEEATSDPLLSLIGSVWFQFSWSREIDVWFGGATLVHWNGKSCEVCLVGFSVVGNQLPLRLCRTFLLFPLHGTPNLQNKTVSVGAPFVAQIWICSAFQTNGNYDPLSCDYVSLDMIWGRSVTPPYGR